MIEQVVTYEFVGSLLGTMVGGLISFFTARHFFKAQNDLRIKKEIELERDRVLSLAFSIAVKVNDISDYVIQVSKNISDAAKAAIDAKDQRVWQHLGEMIGFDRQPVQFSSDEVTFMSVKGGLATYHDASDYGRAVASLSSLIARYNDARNTFMSVAAAQGKRVVSAGEFVGFEASSVELEVLSKKMNQLIKAIAEVANESGPAVAEFAAQLPKMLSEWISDMRFDLAIGKPSPVVAEQELSRMARWARAFRETGS